MVLSMTFWEREANILDPQVSASLLGICCFARTALIEARKANDVSLCCPDALLRIVDGTCWPTVGQ